MLNSGSSTCVISTKDLKADGFLASAITCFTVKRKEITKAEELNNNTFLRIYSGFYRNVLLLKSLSDLLAFVYF